MELFTVSCLNYEICGAQETFDTESEYEIYGDDWMCGECYDSDEMSFFGWDMDADALASAGHGMDEDY